MGIPTAVLRPICGIIDKLMAVYCSWEENEILCASLLKGTPLLKFQRHVTLQNYINPILKTTNCHF